MDSIQLTLTQEEADCLHSLLVTRRHLLMRFCMEHYHSSSVIYSYIQQLKSLEAKLMQMSLGEYSQVEEDRVAYEL